MCTHLGEEQKKHFTKSLDTFIEEYIDLLSEHISVELPKPENTNMTNLAEEFEVYKNGLDNVIDSIISSEIFSEDIAGELSAHIDTVKNIFKHYLLRQWCAQNNYFSEVMGIGSSGKKEVEVMMSAITTHLTDTMSNSTSLLTVMQKFKKALGTDMAAITGEGGDESSPESSTSESSSDESDTKSSDEDDNMDDTLDF